MKKCPKCGADIGVTSTRISGENRVRYLGCKGCRCKELKSKQVVPLKYAPPRCYP
jgi:formate dehydrogenase maturation protein FdhE